MFFLFLLYHISSTEPVSQFCGHRLMKRLKLSVPKISLLDRLRQTFYPSTENFRPMKIIFDTYNIDKENLNIDHANLLKNVILPRLADWASKTLLVNGSDRIGTLKPYICGDDFNITTNYTISSTQGDLIVFVGTEMNYDVEYIAQAGACNLNFLNNRPNVGVMQFNTASISWKEKNLETYFRVALHELFHILVFSSELFPFFVSAKSTDDVYKVVDGRSYLITPTVLSFAKSHFNCSSLPGALLEDEGGEGSAGSHFEKMAFGNEIMTAEISAEMPVSPFTLGLAVDSGWYKVVSSSSEHHWWGKDLGCDLHPTKCNEDRQEFCSVANQIDCSADFRGAAVCQEGTFTNNCKVKKPLQNFFCNQYHSPGWELAGGVGSPGPGSRCLIVRNMFQNQSYGCFRTECIEGHLRLQIETKFYDCVSSGQILSFENYSIQCPDIERFCELKNFNPCSNDCSGNGYCKVNGECNCFQGYFGNDCAVEDVSYLKNSIITNDNFQSSASSNQKN